MRHYVLNLCYMSELMQTLEAGWDEHAPKIVCCVELFQDAVSPVYQSYFGFIIDCSNLVIEDGHYSRSLDIFCKTLGIFCKTCVLRLISCGAADD